VTPSLCPRGYYCKEGLDPYICPIGTLCDAEGLTDPKPCPPGTLCNVLGLGGGNLSASGSGSGSTQVLTPTEIITALVKKGTILNYDQCVQYGVVWDLSVQYTLPGDDPGRNATRRTMCSPFYNNPGWSGGGNTSDDRKLQYKGTA